MDLVQSNFAHGKRSFWLSTSKSFPLCAPSSKATRAWRDQRSSGKKPPAVVSGYLGRSFPFLGVLSLKPPPPERDTETHPMFWFLLESSRSCLAKRATKGGKPRISHKKYAGPDRGPEAWTSEKVPSQRCQPPPWPWVNQGYPPVNINQSPLKSVLKWVVNSPSPKWDPIGLDNHSPLNKPRINT